MRRAQAHATAVPRDLVEASSRAVSRSEMVWREARRDSDFAKLEPHLAEVLRLQREIGQAKGAALGLDPYDALLDSYDPGMRRAAIDPLFADLTGWLPALIARARELQASRPAPLPLDGPFDVAVQRDLGLKLMEAVGFDFSRGRLDISLHPFCGGATDDVRITTRYDEADFGRALMGVLHETGHALYEQGRPASWRQPAGGLGPGHEPAREPVAHRGDAGLPEPAVLHLPGAAPARGVRAVGAGMVAGEPARAQHPGRAGLHPGRCRRGDLPGPHPPALPAGDAR